MSLGDALRNFLNSLAPQEVEALHMKSCLSCSFHKTILRDHFCGQVQPPSRILNLHDAQICIYYSPETVTTGQITQAERETATSQIEILKRINSLDIIMNIFNPIRNASFAYGTEGWYLYTEHASRVYDEVMQGYCIKIANAGATHTPSPLIQLVAVDSNKWNNLEIWAKKDTVSGANIKVMICYTDGTATATTVNILISWSKYLIALDNNKIVSSIEFTDVGGICYLALPLLVENFIPLLDILNPLVNEVAYGWTNGVLQTETYKKGGVTVATLTYTWNGDGTLQKVVRT